MMEILDIQKLNKTYRFPGGAAPRSVLQELDLTLETGDRVAILGPSGSGKSTLLNIIGALDSPDSGRILFNGRDVAGMPGADRNRFRNRKIGFVFQQHHLLSQHTVWENVLIPVLAFPRSPQEKKASVEWATHLLELCGMIDRRYQRPGQLSGGECLRAALVRALINKPLLLLADEPTGSLDRATADAVGDLLVRLNRELNTTLLVVTHATFLASKMKRQLQLVNGRLLAVTQKY